ncbi:MAG: Ig-like domain-containing protein [Clostridia bacterium]|nr:Ig-like domain-containing protein [Clostridia bacterium]
MKKSAISILLTICMLFGLLPIGAFTESMEAPSAEIGEVLTADQPDAEVDESAGLSLGDAEDAEDDAGAADTDAFAPGYASVTAAVLLGETLGNWSDPVPAGAVVYVNTWDGARAEVCFDTPRGIVTGWVDSGALRPLDASEAEAFVRAAGADARCLDAEGLLPLMRLGQDPEVEADGDVGSDDRADGKDNDVSQDEKTGDVPFAVSDGDPSVGPEDPNAPGASQDDEPTDDAPGEDGAEPAVSEGDAAADDDAAAGTSDGAQSDGAQTGSETQGAVATDDVATDGPGPDGGSDDAEATDGETGDAIPALLSSASLVTLDVTELTLRVGETSLLTATVPEEAGTISWSVEDESVAQVDGDGVVEALAEGETKVTATAESGDKAECALTVRKVPDAISFDVTALKMGVGEISTSLKSVKDDEGHAYEGAISYRSSKSKVVKVYADGSVKALKRGTSVITARVGDLTASCTVTVKKAPKKITASPSKFVLGKGETAKVGWKLNSGAAGSVTVMSDSDAVASVTDGIVTGNDVGTTTLRLQTYKPKVKTTARVEVREAPTSVAFTSPSPLVIGVGEKVALKASVNDGAASALTFSSADDSIAKVTGSSVTGIKADTTTLTVSTYVDGVESQCAVEVKPAPTSITLNYRSNLAMGVGESIVLEPNLGEAAGRVSYKSSNKKVAKVFADGTVKAIKRGTATITATTYNNKRVKLKIKVYNAPKWIKAAPAELKLGIDERAKLGYKRSSGSGGGVRFELIEEVPDEAGQQVLEVDPETGYVTARALGTAKVRAVTFNGKSDEYTVTACPRPESITLQASELKLGKKQTLALKPVLSPEGSSSAITYKSSNTKVAKVSGNGVITAVGKGTATITASTYVEGVSAEAVVTVLDAPKWVKLYRDGSGEIYIGDPVTLKPTIPSRTCAGFSYKTSNAAIATVDSSGVVTARKRGTVTITVRTHNGKKATLKLRIYDPDYPESVTLLKSIPVLDKGGTSCQMDYQVIPSRAASHIRWTSACTDVIRVDQQGVLTPVGFGYSKVIPLSEDGRKLNGGFEVAVQSEDFSLTIPARITAIDKSAIKANQKKITAIQNSALKEIERLKNGGIISASDAARRKEIVNNIFKSYNFPWVTPYKQLYWKKANSEGGRKDFKPGQVYYGMPYISGSGSNRAYTVAGAMSRTASNSGYYVDTGEGYYKLTKNNASQYNKRSYRGNDCSGLVGTSIWGFKKSGSALRTCEISKSKRYKKVSKSHMRPGDLICKSYAHVVMFLYYCDAAKTKIMIIENGGSELGTNTVHCSVMNLSKYKNYTARRVKTLG